MNDRKGREKPPGLELNFATGPTSQFPAFQKLLNSAVWYVDETAPAPSWEALIPFTAVGLEDADK